jgi:hypothetical protein
VSLGRRLLSFFLPSPEKTRMNIILGFFRIYSSLPFVLVSDIKDARTWVSGQNARWIYPRRVIDISLFSFFRFPYSTHLCSALLEELTSAM